MGMFTRKKLGTSNCENPFEKRSTSLYSTDNSQNSKYQRHNVPNHPLVTLPRKALVPPERNGGQKDNTYVKQWLQMQKESKDSKKLSNLDNSTSTPKNPTPSQWPKRKATPSGSRFPLLSQLNPNNQANKLSSGPPESMKKDENMDIWLKMRTSDMFGATPKLELMNFLPSKLSQACNNASSTHSRKESSSNISYSDSSKKFPLGKNSFLKEFGLGLAFFISSLLFQPLSASIVLLLVILVFSKDNHRRNRPFIFLIMSVALGLSYVVWSILLFWLHSHIPASNKCLLLFDTFAHSQSDDVLRKWCQEIPIIILVVAIVYLSIGLLLLPLSWYYYHYKPKKLAQPNV